MGVEARDVWQAQRSKRERDFYTRGFSLSLSNTRACGRAGAGVALSCKLAQAVFTAVADCGARAPVSESTWLDWGTAVCAWRPGHDGLCRPVSTVPHTIVCRSTDRQLPPIHVNPGG
jgi:hypothetical protein